MKKILLLSFVSLLLQTAYAQWSTDVTANTAICSTPAAQFARTGTVVTTDLAGSMFIAWIDARSSGGGDSIYLQKVSLSNAQIFAEDGLLVAASTTAISNLSITPDGAGGVLLAWQTNNDIFAQRVSAVGAIVWANPMPLSVSTALNQTSPQITLVNLTEAMVAFNDNRNGNTDIYLNKIALSTGNLLLTIDTPVCKATGTQNQFSIIPDLNGGAYIAWSDGRGANIDLYALRVKNDGLAETGWTVDGTLICSATGTQSNSVIVPDLAGGAYIVWEDFRAGNTDVYAQRISGASVVAWDANGVVVSNPTGNQQGPQAWPVNDGVIVTWTDARLATSNRDIFAQKMIAGTGVASWTANGVVICDAPANQPSATTNGLKIVPDNANGAIIVWNDLRNAATTGNDIYAQRINNSGAVQWTANGIVVSSATGNQGPDLGVVPITASNGAFIVWQDSRSGTTNGEIYGGVITGTGNLTSSLRDRILLEGKISAYPIPTQNQITVSLSKVKPGNYIVQVIDVSGRIILQNKTSVNGSEGTIITNVQSLQRGNYYLRLTHESSKAETLLSFTKQ